MTLGSIDVLGSDQNSSHPATVVQLVSFPSFTSLSNAEVFEDDVQDLLRSYPTGDPSQAGQRQPDALGCQGQVHVTVALVLSQGRRTLLQMGPVTGLGQCGGARQRVATPTEEAGAQNQPD